MEIIWTIWYNIELVWKQEKVSQSVEQVRLKLAELESNQEGPKQKARLRRAATQRAKQMKVYYINDLSSDSETGILRNILL